MKTIGVLTGIDSYETLKGENPDMILSSVAGGAQAAVIRGA